VGLDLGIGLGGGQRILQPTTASGTASSRGLAPIAFDAVRCSSAGPVIAFLRRSTLAAEAWVGIGVRSSIGISVTHGSARLGQQPIQQHGVHRRQWRLFWDSE
jgi:hypothetical protein